MLQAEQLVVYYSCFDYSIDTEDFSHIEPFRSAVLSLLDSSWNFYFSQELEFLNIRYSKYPLELCCEVYLSMLLYQPSSFPAFRDIFICEMLLQSIYISGNPEIFLLDTLLNQFYISAARIANPPNLTTFKLLPSCKKAPDLQALVIAEEAVTTLSQKICHVLRKVSMPVEQFVGPEITKRISDYLNGISSRVLKTQQVTSSFVTNIVELKRNGDVKVRVIKPATEFYDKVLETWKNCTDGDGSRFVLELKGKLGMDWNEKLVNPALCFYGLAREEWEKSKRLGYNFFLKKMQERLIETWKQNIIETSKHFQEHMITKTIM